MRKYLLPENGCYFKANLHSHSTVSDGHYTPEEMKREYMKQGYSIIAYTDHNVMIDHSDLAEEGFLPLNGWEIDLGEAGKAWSASPKVCHICLIAKEPDNKKQVCFRRKAVPAGAAKYKDRICFDESLPDYQAVYTPEGVSEIMKIGRDNGFFVTYNHPAWSLETRDEYLHYHGMHAMEICNFGCYEAGYEDYVPFVYDEILRGGERIYCIAADDNHNLGDNPHHDSFGGFTMIKADKLEYRAVTKALEDGSFYASMGPEIYDLYMEDDKVYITCSPAAKITYHSGVRHSSAVWAKKGETLTQASFTVKPNDQYIRLCVTDAEGKHANTNAYFLDTL